MKLSNVRAILFDLDGTLYYQAPLRLFMALELCTLPVILGSLKETRTVLRAIKCFRMRREALREVGNPSELLEDLQYHQAAVDAGMDAAEMEDIVSQWMYHRPLKYLKWCRRKGVVSFFAEAQRKGLALGVFSDYPAHEKLEALGLGSYVQLVLSATDRDINAFKPHPRGFLLACERWCVEPAEVLYVGDRPGVDAEGAAAAGMRCIILGGGDGQDSRNFDHATKLTSFQNLQQILPT